MGAKAPYMYTQAVSKDAGFDFDFNPRAYSQATYASELEKRRSRTEQKEPLVTFNKHPDSWAVLPNGKNEHAVPGNIASRVNTCRIIQSGLRAVELLISIGLIVCAVVIQNAGTTIQWIIRVPPIWDTILNVYAIYHLCRSPSRRPSGSSISYHSFAFSMDGSLVPFYVIIGYYAHTNAIEASGTSGRWSTLFSTDGATNIVLEVTWLAAFVAAGLHVISVVLDILLIMAYRKVNRLPPDMNPLDMQGVARIKSGETYDTSSTDYNKFKNRFSTITISSSASIPQGYEIPALDSREVPFFSSRVDADTRWSPASLPPMRPGPTPSHPSSLHSSGHTSPVRSHYSRPDTASPTHSQPQGRASPTRSFISDRSLPLPPAPLNPRPISGREHSDPFALQALQTPLMRRNSWDADDEHMDLGMRSRTHSPLPPPVPAKDAARFSMQAMNKENIPAKSGEVKRMLTVSSSVYSDDGSISSSGTVRKPYGGLVAQAGVRYANGQPRSPELALSPGMTPVAEEGNWSTISIEEEYEDRGYKGGMRNTSTGVDIVDQSREARQRNFSWNRQVSYEREGWI